MDDAGAIYLDDHHLLFQSVDVMTPPCDDPFRFGQIAAANALSDLYARGARPISALHILAFPPEKVPLKTVAAILNGAAQILETEGAAILGGHTLTDNDVKYGLAVTGIAEIDETVSMSGAQPGDSLVLTKPLGTGVVIDYLKKHKLPQAQLETLFNTMARTNAVAARAMIKAGAHAATDITGYGLLGHAYHLAAASGVRLKIHANDLPVYRIAADLFQKGITAGAHRKNLKYIKSHVEWAIPPSSRKFWGGITADPQTSGGLLIALSETSLSAFQTFMNEYAQPFWIIGEVLDGGGPPVVLAAREVSLETIIG